jgi:glycosyltransferase involved in cell wall biosynthesis
MLKIVVVSNELPPHRLPFFRRLAQRPGLDLLAIFRTAGALPGDEQPASEQLSRNTPASHFVSLHGGHLHDDAAVLRTLRAFAPDVVVTDGFHAHQLCAFGHALVKNVPHVAMTDETYASAQSISSAQQAIRRFVYARSAAFVAASRGGFRLYESYGVPLSRCFRSCLCIDNASFAPRFGAEEKRYDFIFSGHMEEVANPMFVLSVVSETARLLGRKVRLLLVGAGELENRVHQSVARRSEFVDADFVTCSSPEELPALYRSARIFLFPTLSDPWGMAVNEACAAGLPVILTPEAGAAGELVRDGENGFVCDLNVANWANLAALLLENEDTRRNFSARSLWLVEEYNYDNAVNGLLDACRYALDSCAHGHVGKPI